ncbi:MAG: hypothetical protein ACP5PT_00820 [Brevinematia bacterium]
MEKIKLISIILLLLVSLFLYNKNRKLYKELVEINTLLTSCKNFNKELTEKIIVSEQEYKKKTEEILKKANKPVRQVKINPSLKTECDKMEDLIKKYLDENDK